MGRERMASSQKAIVASNVVALLFALALIAGVTMYSTQNPVEETKFSDDLFSDSKSVLDRLEDQGSDDDDSFGNFGTSDLDAEDSEDTEDTDSSPSGSSELGGLSDFFSSASKTKSVPDTMSALHPLDALEDNADAADDSSSKTLSPGDDVTVQYKLSLAETGKEVYRQWGPGDGGSFTFQLGGGHVIPGFDSAISEMSVGETKSLTIPAAQAYGSKGFEGMGIPPNADLDYTIKVISKD